MIRRGGNSKSASCLSKYWLVGLGGIVALLFLWNLVMYSDQLCEQRVEDAKKKGREDMAGVVKELQLGHRREAHLVKTLNKRNAEIKQLQQRLLDATGSSGPGIEEDDHSVPTSSSPMNNKDGAHEHVADTPMPTPTPQAIQTNAPAPGTPKVGVVVIAHIRVEYLKRCLASIKARMPADLNLPVYVSQDGTSQNWSHELEALVKSTDGVQHIKHLNDKPLNPAPGEQASYYAIARHYGFALNKMFNEYGFDAVIILEEDLEVAPDLFDYFMATLPLLQKEEKLWCVSAWNDNGMEANVKDPRALYRADFFPGLGWMLDKKLWAELGPKWARGYWDDWMREPQQRRGRQCLRPEISRTFTFGAQGVSAGQFFQSHLQHIKLNDQPVPFRTMDLSYLEEAKYDAQLEARLAQATKVDSAAQLSSHAASSGSAAGEYVVYYDAKHVLSRHLTEFSLMDDAKAGVPRTAYKGIVSFRHQGQMVHLVPQPNNFLY